LLSYMGMIAKSMMLSEKHAFSSNPHPFSLFPDVANWGCADCGCGSTTWGSTTSWRPMQAGLKNTIYPS